MAQLGVGLEMALADEKGLFLHMHYSGIPSAVEGRTPGGQHYRQSQIMAGHTLSHPLSRSVCLGACELCTPTHDAAVELRMCSHLSVL